MTRKIKPRPLAAVGTPAPLGEKKIMQLPAKLALNLDRVGADDIFIFADPETDFRWKHAFMSQIVVGGIAQYHFTLLGPLAEEITRQIFNAMPAGKKNKLLNSS